MAYTTNGTANFNFFINRQGPRGPQGIQGTEGFSPKVEVEEDYGNTFTLRVTNKDTSFVTSNLREHKEDRGGTYVRWDKSTEQMYLGDADALPVASESVLGIIKVANNDDITNKDNSTAITPKQLIENIGSVKNEFQTNIDNITQLINNYYQELINADKQNVKLTTTQTITGTKTFTGDLAAKKILCEKILDSSGDNNIISLSNTGKIVIGGLNANTLTINAQSVPYISKNGTDQGHILTQKTVIAGNNIVISNFSDGIKISATGTDIATTEKAGIVKPDGSTITIAEDGTISSIAQGDVTLAGDNSFTGNNTFDGETTFNAHTWTAEQEAVTLNVTSNATLKNAYVTGTISSLGELTAVSISAAGIKNNQNNKYYLNQASITAGDNITVEETTDGIKISSTASGGGATIDDKTISTTTVYSSDKTVSFTTELISETMTTLNEAITQLQSRVKALEDLIDGGNASNTYPVELQKFSEKTVQGISINEQINSFSEDVQVNEE